MTTSNPGLVAAFATVMVMHFASAFSLVSVSRLGASPCDRRNSFCLQLISDNRDSAEGDSTREEAKSIRRRLRRRNLEYWGVERLSLPSFPSTFDAVADDVFHAISGTICGLQRPDPNTASNAMHQSVLDYRPTHPFSSSKRRWLNGDDSDVTTKHSKRKTQDTSPRMGVEIDGSAYLLEKSNDEGRAMRRLSLQIAKRLSTLPWDKTDSSARRMRSVAIYFNSVEQSLLASRELSLLKKDEKNADPKCFDNIQIHCLGQDSVPLVLVKEKSSTVQEERIILIVKPTDYDANSLIPTHDDSRHPRIQTNVVDKLQALLFQASASSIPAVVLSPRLSELPPLQQASEAYKRTGPAGFEQSGFQKSSTYGGIEPPVGPTSWLLRGEKTRHAFLLLLLYELELNTMIFAADLVPPVFVWVGCANTIFQRNHSRWSLRSVAALFRDQQHVAASFDDPGDEVTYSFYSRVAIVQSAMDTGHSWHMFAVKERFKPRHTESTSKIAPSRMHLSDRDERDVSYHYMGSSIASRGRPSSHIMNDVFEEFCEHFTAK
jgi:hypothetical protein